MNATLSAVLAALPLHFTKETACFASNRATPTHIQPRSSLESWTTQETEREKKKTIQTT